MHRHPRRTHRQRHLCPIPFDPSTHYLHCRIVCGRHCEGVECGELQVVEFARTRLQSLDPFRMESVLDDDLGRAWCVQTLGDTVAVGYDRGCVVHSISRRELEVRYYRIDTVASNYNL